MRSIDVASDLNYKMSSVSVAMKNLCESGYINIAVDGYITLTESGRQIPETMLERHTLLSEWIMHLGVNKVIAIEDACRMEHVISSESFDATKRHTGGT